MIARYQSVVMTRIFSPRNRIVVWRRLWLALARAQRAMGEPISESVLNALDARIESIDWVRVEELEAECHHDVVAHRRAFEELVDGASGVLHRGATSAFVVDNGDLILQREALEALEERLESVLTTLRDFSFEWADCRVVGRTHLQPAAITTIGYRAARWAADLIEDRELLRYWRDRIRGRGCRGSVGTGAVARARWGAEGAEYIEERVMREFDLAPVYPVVSQTYSRKIDWGIQTVLAALADSMAGAALDLRLMAAFGEFEEPFGEHQTGSSAMPHKRNPILAERIGSLARRVRTGPAILGETLATQGLERTLDDSAIRRLVIPESFHLVDYSLGLLERIVRGGRVKISNCEAEIHQYQSILEYELALIKSDNREAEYERLRELSIDNERAGDEFSFGDLSGIREYISRLWAVV